MAKELPYFKFETSQWENGSIQLCSRETKGLFIDICSIYWARLGDLKTKLVIQKLCNGNANALHELTSEKIIEINGGKIIINFLDEQLNEVSAISKQRSKAAKKRWSKTVENNRVDANAMQMHSKSNAIRREEKRKEENNIPPFDLFLEYAKSKDGKISPLGLKHKYDAWIENDWRDGYDKPIKNWKSKLLNALKYIDKIKEETEWIQTGLLGNQ